MDWFRIWLGALLLPSMLLAAPLLADWNVQQDTIGEGIPTWMALVKSRDGKLLFWLEYPTVGIRAGALKKYRVQVAI